MDTMEYKNPNENPWYIMLTEGGVAFWNRWAKGAFIKEDGSFISDAKQKQWEGIIAEMRNSSEFTSPMEDTEFRETEAKLLKNYGQFFDGNQLPNPNEEIDFGGYEFKNYIYFNYIIFPTKVNFFNATFTKVAHFMGATFTEEANFGYATFTEQAYFCGARFTERADFDRARFTEEADFWNARFTEGADFGRARFTKWASFRDARFTKGAYFENATFTKRADFESARFTEEASFIHAIFTEVADFSDATFTEGADFSYIKFTDMANFRGASFCGMVNFELADFIHCTRLSLRDAKIDDGKLGEVFFYFNGSAQGIIDVTNFELMEKLDKIPTMPSGGNKEEIERRITSWNYLKHSMKLQERTPDEISFFIKELEARAWQDKRFKPIVSIYQGVSDFGRSVFIPITWLVVMFLLMSVFYVFSMSNILTEARWDGGKQIIIPPDFDYEDIKSKLSSAFYISASRTIPLLPKSKSMEDRYHDINKMCGKSGGDKNIDMSSSIDVSGSCVFLINFLEILHSIMSLALLFLIGLALRNKLRIK